MTDPADPSSPPVPTRSEPGAYPSAEPAYAPAPEPAAGFDHSGRVRRSRVSGIWVGLITAGVFLILLLIFIAQNQVKVPIHFLGLNGRVPLGLTVLLAGILGLLVAGLPGSIRILQLRRALKRNTPPNQRAGT